MKRTISQLVMVAIVALVPLAVLASEAETPELVKIVEAHKAAKRAGDYDQVKALQAEDARIWFEKKEGEGKPLEARGGPWSEWDRFFNATSEVIGEWEIGDHMVSARVQETNEYYRLLDRPASTYRATYYFDDNNRISGLLIDGSEQTRDPGRTDEFMAWAKEHRPGLIEKLMPEGRMDPALEKAKLWKQTLLEWRAEAKLPPIE